MLLQHQRKKSPCLEKYLDWLFSVSSEQIRVNGCGYFVFLLYPGAYVDLHQEQLQMISAVRQLRYDKNLWLERNFFCLKFFQRIYCAGVFHNMVLVLLALIFLLINPIFIRSFYTEAAVVSRVAKVNRLPEGFQFSSSHC